MTDLKKLITFNYNISICIIKLFKSFKNSWILFWYHIDYLFFWIRLWHRANGLWWVFVYCSPLFDPDFLELMLYFLASCCNGGSLKLFISSWYASLSLLMAFAWCCRQWTIPFFTLYRWMELKLRYCQVKVDFWYMYDLIPCSVQIINISRKYNLLSCSFSIVNCIDGWIEFTWSSCARTSSWWDQRMNASSVYLSHIDGLSNIDPNAISSKYSMYMLANTGDSGDPIASPPFCWYMSDPIPK